MQIKKQVKHGGEGLATIGSIGSSLMDGQGGHAKQFDQGDNYGG